MWRMMPCHFRTNTGLVLVKCWSTDSQTVAVAYFEKKQKFFLQQTWSGFKCISLVWKYVPGLCCFILMFFVSAVWFYVVISVTWCMILWYYSLFSQQSSTRNSSSTPKYQIFLLWNVDKTDQNWLLVTINTKNCIIVTFNQYFVTLLFFFLTDFYTFLLSWPPRIKYSCLPTDVQNHISV